MIDLFPYMHGLCRLQEGNPGVVGPVTAGLSGYSNKSVASGPYRQRADSDRYHFLLIVVTGWGKRRWQSLL